ncbi:MAG: Fe-S cluster assembly protein SufD [Firmicutes bacterium]|nr:Fe-S cluster assembly protein SufD [Bacillota bacterium]
MSEVMEVSGLSAPAQALFAERGDSSELLAMRSAALSVYEQLPAPKYEKSDISRRKMDAFSLQVAPAFMPDETWKSLAQPYFEADSEHPMLVVQDGQVVYTRGTQDLERLGIRFLPIREAARQYPNDVLTRLHQAVPYDQDKWLALQAGLWNEGVYVYVPKGVICPHPLQFIHVVLEGGRGSFVHNLVVGGEQSEVTLLETYLAAQDLTDNLHIGVSEVFVGAGAKVTDGVVQDLPRHSTAVIVRRAIVERDGSMDWVLGEVGDGYTVAEVGSRLVGTGSHSTSHTVALGSGRAHADMTARMVHEAKFTESDTTARGVMQGRANAVYRGVTHILKGASGSNGQQSEKLLMMSKESRADAIPMLLIDENDVKCGHAASVGQINEEQLFYLMSRGVSEAEAKRMVVWGFLDPVLAKLPLSTMRTAVERVLERKMK